MSCSTNERSLVHIRTVKFGYKTGTLPLPKKPNHSYYCYMLRISLPIDPKYLDPSLQDPDLDFWNCFGRVIPSL